MQHGQAPIKDAVAFLVDLLNSQEHRLLGVLADHLVRTAEGRQVADQDYIAAALARTACAYEHKETAGCLEGGPHTIRIEHSKASRERKRPERRRLDRPSLLSHTGQRRVELEKCSSRKGGV